jgi:hypothetical protein
VIGDPRFHHPEGQSWSIIQNRPSECAATARVQAYQSCSHRVRVPDCIRDRLATMPHTYATFRSTV